MELSRRNFIRGAAMAAAGIAGAGALAEAAYATDGSTASSTSGSAGSSEASAASETDVLIVGGGLAGMCAGLQVIENGAKALIVDKADDIATYANSAISGGSFATPGEDTDEGRQAFIDDFNKKSKGKGDPDLTKAIADNIQDTLAWLTDQGAVFNDPIENPPYSCLKVYASPAIFQGMGTLTSTLSAKYTADGGEKMVDAKLIDLVVDDTGKVAGAKVRTSEGIKTIEAKAVIIASGGYVGNKQLLEEFVSADADEILLRGHASMTGDGQLAATRAGAMLRQMGGEQSLHIAAVSPQNVASGNPSNAIGYCISINENGQRFTDESLGYVSHGKALMSQPGQTAALVFDQTTKDSVDNVNIVVEQFAKLDIPIIQADTIEDLAAQINVDPTSLKQTVDDFNAATDGDKTTGLEVDKTALAVKVETAPFYAIYPLQPGCIMGFGGIYCNANAEVLEPDGTVIPNLYVAGEAMGGIFMYDYLAGASLDRCAVFGRIAANSACASIGA